MSFEAQEFSQTTKIKKEEQMPPVRLQVIEMSMFCRPLICKRCFLSIKNVIELMNDVDKRYN